MENITGLMGESILEILFMDFGTETDIGLFKEEINILVSIQMIKNVEKVNTYGKTKLSM